MLYYTIITYKILLEAASINKKPLKSQSAQFEDIERLVSSITGS